MPKYVALFRGINVGRAKTIQMADLAGVFRALGYSDVATVLRSGNVVFRADHALPPTAPATIERAVLDATGVQSSVLVIDSAAFRAITDANPLRAHPLADVAIDGSKSFVTFVRSMPTRMEEPDTAALAPEILAVGRAAVYQWMPDGSQQTKVPRAFWKQFSEPVTARNANTVAKLAALLDA